MLPAALRRMGLSGSGTNAVLASRLAGAEVMECARISVLASEWEEHHCVDPALDNNLARVATGRTLEPNRSRHETARLCHVIADARNQIAVQKMYQRIDTRAELDAARIDPFELEFVQLFNSGDFLPSYPDPVDGITEDLLRQFDPSIHPHVRNGTMLKQRWTKLRSSYITASQNYNRSGQSDPGTFPSFTNGDESVSYMHFVFL